MALGGVVTMFTLLCVGGSAAADTRGSARARAARAHRARCSVPSARMDCRWVERDGPPFLEVRWDGDDEGDQVNGRGWAALALDNTLSGHLFFHMGDDSSFRATPLAEDDTGNGH